MARPSGRFTYDDALGRFRNAAGQLIPDSVILPTAVGLTTSSDDALEMLHAPVIPMYLPSGATALGEEHVAGAATPEWLRHMKDGLRQPCMGCGVSVGLADVTLSGEHSRDWGKSV